MGGERFDFGKIVYGYSKSRRERGDSGGTNSLNVLSRIRQVGELLSSILSYKNGKLKVTLNKAITGISEGQAIVLYQGKKCLGGGVIGFS